MIRIKAASFIRIISQHSLVLPAMLRKCDIVHKHCDFSAQEGLPSHKAEQSVKRRLENHMSFPNTVVTLLQP